MTIYQDRHKPSARALEQGIAPLPLDQAETTLWMVRRGPSRGKTGPMAKLYQEGDMDIEDFAWIILNWDDPEKKRAAYTLLADKLRQPQIVLSVLRHGPDVIGGSKYLEEQQYESMYYGLFSALWGVVSAVLLIGAILWNAASRVLEGYPWPVTLIATLIVLAVLIVPLALFARHDYKRQMSRSRDFRMGREGEQWAAERVRAKLDSRWTVFRNLKLPNRKGDCDLVLVGSPGVYVLEVKAHRRTIRVKNGVWEEENRSRWRTMSQNPQAQATGAAVDVKDWLNRHGVVISYVKKAVVLTQPQPSTDFATAKAPVWLHYDFEDRLNNLNSAPAVMSDEVVEHIVSILKEASSSSHK